MTQLKCGDTPALYYALRSITPRPVMASPHVLRPDPLAIIISAEDDSLPSSLIIGDGPGTQLTMRAPSTSAVALADLRACDPFEERRLAAAAVVHCRRRMVAVSSSDELAVADDFRSRARTLPAAVRARWSED